VRVDIGRGGGLGRRRAARKNGHGGLPRTVDAGAEDTSGCSRGSRMTSA
jgi:hypothetical protein